MIASKTGRKATSESESESALIMQNLVMSADTRMSRQLPNPPYQSVIVLVRT